MQHAVRPHNLIFLVSFVLYAPVNVNPRPPSPPGRDIAGHLRGIFHYLTSERTAGIGDFDLFCTSPKNSGGVDRGIFHRGGRGQESQVRQDGGFWPRLRVVPHFSSLTLRKNGGLLVVYFWPRKEGKSRFISITLYLWLSMSSVLKVVV